MEFASQVTYEEFKPTSIEWSQEPANHILRVDLPGFKAEDLKVQVDNSGKLKIRGRKKVEDNRYSHLKLVFDTPKEADVEKMFGKFDNDCLTLVMPKKEGEELLTLPPSGNAAAVGAVRTREKHRGRDKPGYITIGDGGESLVDKMMAYPWMDYLKEKMSERKELITVAAVAFSVGFYISRRIKSS